MVFHKNKGVSTKIIMPKTTTISIISRTGVTKDLNLTYEKNSQSNKFFCNLANPYSQQNQ